MTSPTHVAAFDHLAGEVRVSGLDRLQRIGEHLLGERAPVGHVHCENDRGPVPSELEQRSGGFRPSPGSVYPTLQMLEEGGYVTGEQIEGKKVYTITDAGNDTGTTTVVESCGANGTRTDTAAANSFECTFPEGPATSDVALGRASCRERV